MSETTSVKTSPAADCCLYLIIYQFFGVRFRNLRLFAGTDRNISSQNLSYPPRLYRRNIMSISSQILYTFPSFLFPFRAYADFILITMAQDISPASFFISFCYPTYFLCNFDSTQFIENGGIKNGISVYS